MINGQYCDQIFIDEKLGKISELNIFEMKKEMRFYKKAAKRFKKLETSKDFVKRNTYFYFNDMFNGILLEVTIKKQKMNSMYGINAFTKGK